MDPKMDKKSSKIHCCEKCNYVTSKQSQYERHILTRKHKILTNTDAIFEKNALAEFICPCGKIYKHRQSLFTHQKRCNFIIEEIKQDSSNNIDITDKVKENQDYKDMFFKIMQENTEFKDLLITQQRQIIEQQKQIGELIPRVGNNNTVKQKFNINIFLNEHCRDAINMDEFLKQIEVSMHQLDLTKSKGITEGLSNVFIENMNKLSVYERPLHCTDAKRETLYIKENNTWEKDCDKSRIRAALREASTTQYKTMQKWIDANPDYMEHPEKQEYFLDMVRNCGQNIDNIDDKIIKRICSTSYIKELFNYI